MGQHKHKPISAQSILHSNQSWEEIEKSLREYEYEFMGVPRPPPPPPPPKKLKFKKDVLRKRLFTYDQIAQMRARYNGGKGESIAALAREFGCSHQSMTLILKNRTYKDDGLPEGSAGSG